ncbi:hypothetical protein EDB92DRAFT_1827550 [Lactarius akahatsu]|uniref:Uncharacterized protein n=1 Tax=Lactarius akahatsu TaxID=416441 RepID=A0AAD4QDB2_9AGAM|nr:hypothetical protein EDB92DRAFT_1827550 [Lactarius akahatsu]
MCETVCILVYIITGCFWQLIHVVVKVSASRGASTRLRVLLFWKTMVKCKVRCLHLGLRACQGVRTTARYLCVFFGAGQLLCLWLCLLCGHAPTDTGAGQTEFRHWCGPGTGKGIRIRNFTTS